MRKGCSQVASTSDARSSTLKRARMVSNLEMEEDEEMTTTDEDRESATKAKDDPDDDDEEEEEEDETPLPEALALTRTRRPNAGRRMAELMAQQGNEKDDFYGTLYGGFEEAEQDEDFESPPHSSDEEAAEDEVDSDFDKDEEEEGNEAGQVEEDPEQIERRRKRLNQKRLLEHNKNWAIARINRKAVPENACDPKTQRQRLEEAKQTAELNIASLKRFEDMELERRRRQQKPTKRCALDGPRVRELWTSDGQHLITFVPEPPPTDQCFPKLKPREFRVCAISGQPARYVDPVTKLPYADIDAFRVLREKYRQFLETDREQQQQQQRKKL